MHNKMNTKIGYLYRDASNYKVWNEVVVEGVMTESQKETIQACLFDGENFIPHLVGLPETTFVDLGYQYSEQDDTPFFELSVSNIESTVDEQTESLTVDELVKKFISLKGKWV